VLIKNPKNESKGFVSQHFASKLRKIINDCRLIIPFLTLPTKVIVYQVGKALDKNQSINLLNVFISIEANLN